MPEPTPRVYPAVYRLLGVREDERANATLKKVLEEVD